MKSKVRKGVAVVIYRKVNNDIKFLILERKEKEKGWEIVKGGIKSRESIRDAALREVKEETGLKNITFKKILPYEFKFKMIKNGHLEERKYKVVLVESFKGVPEPDKKLFKKAKFLDKNKAIKKIIWPKYRKAIEVASNYLS